MTNIEKLENLHPDLISEFLATGQCSRIPEEMKMFLKQLQWAVEIFETERNITRAARKLKLRINAQQGVSVEVRTCMARIYEAINYFNVDCNVSIKVWESNFANKYEDLAKLCAERRDYKNMKLCYDAALECRRRASEIAEADRDMGSDIRVIESKSIGEGYSALSMLDYESGDADEIQASLIEAMQDVTTGMVTRAVRTTTLNGVEVTKDDYIGFVSHRMIVSTKEKLDAVKALTDDIATGKEFIIVAYGKDATEEERVAYAEFVASHHAGVEFYEINGEQDVYDFLLIVE